MADTQEEPSLTAELWQASNLAHCDRGLPPFLGLKSTLDFVANTLASLWVNRLGSEAMAVRGGSHSP
jgi:hypothetical protein